VSDRRALLERYRAGAAEAEAALAGATEADLDRRPADGGWTPRQVAHHLADSEAMAYTRLRRLVADETPVIQGYDEPRWAERLHYERPIEEAMAVVRAVRSASLSLLESLRPDEWERTGTHSESGSYSVDDWLGIYASHCHDHARQIREARG
jgi:hypothetical protein